MPFPLSITELKSLYSSLRSDVWNTTHTRMADDLDFYNGEFHRLLGQKPAAVRWKIPPTHRYIIDDAVDQIDPVHARITVEERQPVGKERLDAVAREQELGNQFWEEMWSKLNQTTRTAPSWDFVKQLVSTGMAAFKVEPREQLQSPEPFRFEGESDNDYQIRLAVWKRRYDNRPKVALKSLSGTNLLTDYLADDPEFVIEFYERDRYRLALDYPWMTDILKKKSKTCLWVEIWSADWYGMFADWRPVLKTGDPESGGHNADSEGFAPNPFGFIPYVIRYSGYGTRDPRGRPEYEAVGMLRFVQDSLISEARLRSQLDWMREEYSWGTLLAKHADDETAQAWVDRFERQPGRMIPTPAGLDVVPLVSPEMPRELFREEEMIRRDIQSATFVRAIPSPRAESGAARHLALQETKIKLEPPIEATRQAIREACWMVARMQSEYIGEPIAITASVGDIKKVITVSPSLLMRIADVSVEIEPRSEDEKARHQQRIDQLYERGAVSLEELASAGGVDDFSTQRKKRDREDLSRDQEVLAPVKQAIVRLLTAELQKSLPEVPVPPDSTTDVGGQPTLPTESGTPALVEPPQKPIPGSVEESNLALQQMGQVSQPVQTPRSVGPTQV